MSESPQYVVLPARFEDADHQDLVTLIADMLQRLISHNDKIPLSPESLTRFHSRSPPGISVLDYLHRIVKYTNIERTCLLITLHYIDQICARLARFTISSLTVHRFIVSSVAVSSKALCDVFCTNTHYAKVGGIRVAELNLLEKEFLEAIDWRLTCTRELLQEYYVNLARTHSSGKYKIVDPRPPSSTASSGDSDMSRSRSGSPLSSPTQASLDDSLAIAEPAGVLMGKTVSITAAVTSPGPTLEQNMAFAALQKTMSTSYAEKRTSSSRLVEETPDVDSLRVVKRKLE